MNISINQFLEILAENDYKVQYKEIPDEIDNRDEIIAGLHEILDDDGHLPDSLRYFVVNDMTTSIEITDFIQNTFQSFKTEFLAGNQHHNDSLKQELVKQLNGIRKNIEQKISETKPLKDETLTNLFLVKLRYCDAVNDFLEQKQESGVSKNKKTLRNTVYYFKVEQEFTGKYDIYLNRIYESLKNDLNLINCTPVQFKNLFRPSGKTRRATPEPIVWLSGSYSHLAYFIKCLAQSDFIPNSKHPSFNQIAKKLFYDNVEGKYFETSNDKSDVKDPNISPYHEIKNIVNIILKN